MSSVKGCPNGECAAHKEKTLFKVAMNYCPNAGQNLQQYAGRKAAIHFLTTPRRSSAHAAKQNMPTGSTE